MSKLHREPEQDPEPQLPPALAEDLKALFGGHLDVPRDADARIWAAARQHSLSQQRRRVAMRWLQAGAAVAAAIILVVWVTMPAVDAVKRIRPASEPLVLKDQRRVDILDAFTLARSIERRASLDASWDLNRDGSIDRQDVDLIAARAVSLQERVIQ